MKANNNLIANLQTDINSRKTQEQRDNEAAYVSKMELLASIHAEIAAARPNRDDGFDNSDINGNNTRYVTSYDVAVG